MRSRKVLVIVPFPMSEENRLQRAAQLGAVELGPDIVFHFRPVRAGPANYTSDHDSALAELSILDAGMRAQEEGYDAVCIDTMSDSGLAALRSVLDIPVIGPGRAAMLTALMFGERFSILVMWDRWRHLCIDEDGADVILLGSTTMHQAHGYLRDNLPVPVINPGPLSYKLAEAALALGLTQSRKAHARPTAPKRDMIDAMMTAAAAPRGDGA
jgi:allantoin racemase